MKLNLEFYVCDETSEWLGSLVIN